MTAIGGCARPADGRFTIAIQRVRSRHRMNIGVIVEAARLKVMRLNEDRQDRPHPWRGRGELCARADGGRHLHLCGRDARLRARPRPHHRGAPRPGGGEPKIPAYAGGQMPLSTYLADGVRHVLSTPSSWRRLPREVREWLELQQEFSHHPAGEHAADRAFSAPAAAPHRVLYFRRPPRQPDARPAGHAAHGAAGSEARQLHR